MIMLDRIETSSALCPEAKAAACSLMRDLQPCADVSLQCLILHSQTDGDTISRPDETQNGRHYVVQRHRCPNFVVGHLT